MIKKGSFSANFLVLFSGNTIAQIVPFLFAPLIARLFPEEEIAVRANFLALASILAIVGAARYEMALVLPADKSKAMNLVGLSVRLILLVTLFSGLFYIFRDYVDSFYKDGSIGPYLIFLMLAVPLYALTNLLSQWLIREKKYSALTSSGIARSAFTNIFTLMFGYASMGILGLVLGTLLGFLVALVMQFIAARSSMQPELITAEGRKQVAREYKDFPMINAPHAFVDLLFSQVILYAIITREYGLKELGYFTMMSALLLASMRAIGGAVGQLYYKEASDLRESGGNVSAVLFRSVKLVAIFAVPACIGVFFFGPELFGWFLGDAYMNSGVYAQVMIFPFFLNFLISPISGTPIIYRQQTKAFIFSLIGYLLSILTFMTGNYIGFSFKESLMLFAVAQSLYYAALFIWYIQLTRTRK